MDFLKNLAKKYSEQLKLNKSLNTITTKLLMLFLFMTIIPLIVLAQFSTDLIKSYMSMRAKTELQLNNRVSQLQYKESLKNLKNLVVQGMSTPIEEAYYDYKLNSNHSNFRTKLRNISRKGDLSFLFILNHQHDIMASANTNKFGEKINSFSDLIDRVLLNGQPTSSTEIFLPGDIKNDGSEIENNAKIRPLGEKEDVIVGMSQVVALPIYNTEENVEAIAIAGKLLVRDNSIADAIKELTGASFMISQVFDNKETIVIATNMFDENGYRLIGKKVSPEIAQEVMSSSLRDWQIREKIISEYEWGVYSRIMNSKGHIIGMSYVGISEKQFTSLAEDNINLVSRITILGLFCAILLSSIFSRSITTPILKLADAAKSVSQGDLSVRVNVKGSDEIIQMGDTFNIMAESLQREEQLRDDFVATLTHDLRVPLLAENRIVKYMIDEKYGPISEEQREVLNEIQTTNAGTIDMVNTLLEVYRYDAGKNMLLTSNTDIKDLIASTVRSLMPLTEDKKLNVSTSLPEQELIVKIDEREIKRVIHNLISNAIACSLRRGSIRITLSRFKDKKIYSPDDKDFQHSTLKKEINIHNQVIVSVYDTGIGMDKEEISNLFMRFSGNKGRKPSSIGLGLYYSQQVVKAHGGHIWAESQEGEGSAFKFSLPISEEA